MDGLSSLLNASNIGCFINNASCNHLFYADDLCLLAPCASALQELLNVCEGYGISHDIMFNPKKSQCLVFKHQRFQLRVPSVSLNKESIPKMESVKYLGIILDEHSNDEKEMLKQMKGLYARCNSILSKLEMFT